MSDNELREPRQARLRLRAKNYLLTWPRCNADLGFIMRVLQDKFAGKVKYICVCGELHREGDPHRHAFLALNEQVPADQNTFDIPNSIEGAPAYHGNYQGARSPRDALQYVKKDGNFIEIGECPVKEKMSMAEKNRMMLERNLEDLVDEGEISLYRYKQLLVARNQYYMSRRANKARLPPKVYWLWGPTGSGKTRYAVEQAGDEYWISNHSEWFDGYWGQKCVIIDDLRSGTYKFSFLLRLLDRYPMMVQIKGGWEVWHPEVIYITAPERPEKVFINRETGETWDSIDQLIRRIHEFIEFPREATQPTQDWQEIPEGNDGMEEYYTMKTNWERQ